MIIYNQKKNPTGKFIPGVPLQNLTDEFFKSLPEDLQKAVLNQPFYSKEKKKEGKK